jgi:hypothetical protein
MTREQLDHALNPEAMTAPRAAPAAARPGRPSKR